MAPDTTEEQARRMALPSERGETSAGEGPAALRRKPGDVTRRRGRGGRSDLCPASQPGPSGTMRGHS
eukprot:10868540-Alexandrium_andersonii.AAC.1